MSSYREDSPDWLHSFQAPTLSALALSSDSDSPPEDSLVREDQDVDSLLNETSKAKSPRKRLKVEDCKPRKTPKLNNHKKREGKTGGNKGDKKVAVEETSDGEPHASEHSVWMLSSDSEDYIDHEESSLHKTTKFPEKEKDAVLIEDGQEPLLAEPSQEKSPKKQMKIEDHISTKRRKASDHMKGKGHGDDTELAEEETSEKHTEPHFSSSRLPLVLSEKVHRSKALVECEGDSIDLSGDMGAVGRIVISDTPSRNHEMFLDLKGTIYKTTIVPSRTFFIVSCGQSEAKVEAVMNDFMQLKPQSNVYEAETMVEGILEGFPFDSEDEADKMPKANNRQTDQNEGGEEQPNGKTKGKADKTSGVVRKKGKTAGAKPPKKVKRKAQVQKKTKTKK